ncbi:MAG: YgeY family selenium metabolism-linked hydrolase [Synergistaceae bacterium]|jgi:putative selenium metabolism hydrolase|nr:YgeY family selenium metabolism-linked hydrolase [Synergistaceae bacterium]
MELLSMGLLSESRKKFLVEFCQQAIRTKSLSGQEGDMASLLGDAMRKTKFAQVETDRYGNVVGRIVFGGGGKRLLMEGHMDHVDVSDPSKWTHDPYGGEIVDGKLYGRATSDMKGNLCAMLLAAAFVAEDGGSGLDGEVLVAGGVHEECFEGVASEEIVKNWAPDMVVIGEASNLAVKRGQKGRAEIVVETLGKSAHSSKPSAGINAVKKMSRLITALEKEFVPPTHPVLGEGILEVTDVVSSPYPGASVIPELCRATFDRRLLVGESEEDVLTALRRVFARLAAEDLDFQARAALAEGLEKCYTGADIAAKRFAPGWILEDTHPFVQKALAGLSSVGQRPELSHYIFCTNGSCYAGKAAIPTIGYGGSLETLAHVVDEYIEIEHLYRACEGYYGIIGAVLK